MVEDISKKTILVLVVLTIIVSALGTLTVMDSVNRARLETVPTVMEGSNSASGLVQLEIAGEPQPSSATGQVILNVVKTS